MKTMILAAAAVLGIGSGVALADGNVGQPYDQPFTAWVAQGANRAAAPSAVADNGRPLHVYLSHHRAAVSLFQPTQNEGANN
jgi:hypothetical protein